MICLWPRGLAGRLVLLLVTALAVAQAGFVLVFHDEQKNLAKAMAHGRALGQAVTLARLLADDEIGRSERLIADFGSENSCALLVAPGETPPQRLEPVDPEMSALLRRMLPPGHPAGATVSLGRYTGAGHPCREIAPPMSGRVDGGDYESEVRRTSTWTADIVVPLADRRTLVYRTLVEIPPFPTGLVIASFLSSALAISAVVVVAVRWQTRGLGDLVAAAERVGRGEEEVSIVVERGPSEITSALQAFDIMQERRRRFVTDRMRLLAAVSHDLRTQLTTLRLKAEFIDDETTREGMISTIDELIAITQATLSFSRNEVSREETRSVDLVELVGELVEEFRLGDADVTLSGSGPLIYACRPLALKRALRNLVENAVRYGGCARISVATRDGGPVIDVDDDGPGLPENQVEEAFKPFVRLEPSRSHETGGIGLGLAIARGIVHSHGGSLGLANRLGGGLTATLRLPKSDAPT
jgi:signal transduction histidine kinase